MEVGKRYAEEDLLPLSALQHLVFCERQCALLHIENVWEENSLTIEGTHFHQKVHEDLPRREVRGDMVLLRGLSLRSLRLGLVGRADVVELHRVGPGAGETVRDGTRLSIPIQGLPGLWIPFPVEYKLGKPKQDRSDDVQLCAQALCLEEMLHVQVREGALFYGRVRRRHAVLLDETLRDLTRATAERLHRLIESGRTPVAREEPKCGNCSLKDLCLPDAAAPGRSATGYLSRHVEQLLQEVDG
jgi:CRISPR-associated exonuclease Cas4